MRVKWLKKAVQDLIGIRAYIAIDKPQASQDTATRINTAVDQLKEQPYI